MIKFSSGLVGYLSFLEGIPKEKGYLLDRYLVTRVCTFWFDKCSLKKWKKIILQFMNYPILPRIKQIMTNLLTLGLDQSRLEKQYHHILRCSVAQDLQKQILNGTVVVLDDILQGRSLIPFGFTDVDRSQYGISVASSKVLINLVDSWFEKCELQWRCLCIWCCNMYLTLHLYTYTSTYRDVTYFICSFYLPSSFPRFMSFPNQVLSPRLLGSSVSNLQMGPRLGCWYGFVTMWPC